MALRLGAAAAKRALATSGAPLAGELSWFKTSRNLSFVTFWGAGNACVHFVVLKNISLRQVGISSAGSYGTGDDASARRRHVRSSTCA